jgi:uroporphyrinogen decarboxylase
LEAREKLEKAGVIEPFKDILAGHIAGLHDRLVAFNDLGGGRVQDSFGAIWDRSVDKDIGVVSNCALPEPTLKNYTFPDCEDPEVWEGFQQQVEAGNGLRQYSIGFSLYERAWTLRGMENLMMDFIANPGFAHELLGSIADHNIARVRMGLKFDIDSVHFGDDWGMQTGLQMGPRIWKEFIYPELKRMYAVVKEAGKFVTIHSCGKVDSLFDDLIGIGLNCFNPFQPEVMDVEALLRKYRGRLSFHGGLSLQKTLPFGTVEDVKRECRWLMDLGREGSYIFSPSHAVEGDVPEDNLLAFIESVRDYSGYPG